TSVKNTVINIFNALKNSITNIFNAIRNTASTVWNSIKSTVSNIVSATVNTVKNLFNGMKNTVSSIWDGVRNTISNVVNAVKNTISNVWGGITGTVSNIFNGVKNAIDGPMNAAKNLVKNVVDAIKGFFNFNISWPKIPLPHFSISPAGWSAGDLLKGKIPSLGIEWYKDGGIMTQPTIFGMNGNNAMIGGEAGAEAVAPIDTLLGYVETAVRGVMAEQKDGDINVTQYITSPEPLTPREIARETKYKLQDLATLRR
ncbi:TPA: phage tail protein, partial [Enterococcus faecalis]|nr:phage tail protein [Enterococcus faecalis]